MNILKQIEMAFGKKKLVISNIHDLCRSVSFVDTEGLKSTLPFLGLRWQQVKPDIWKKCDGAVSFFSDKAFHYYMPSLIYCSYKDKDATSLATMWVTYEFGWICDFFRDGKLTGDEDSILESSYRRLSLFKIKELEYMKNWFSYLKEIGEGDIEENMDKPGWAVDFLIKNRREKIWDQEKIREYIKCKIKSIPRDY